MLEHKCEVCGRLWRKKLKADGKIVCNKHYKQFKKYGYFRDTSSRTQRDKNKITIKGDIAYIDLYDTFYNVIGQAIIDFEDIDRVKNLKWRLNHNGYVYNNSKSSEFLHRRILNCTSIVDHINGNRLDNRKCNLRPINKSQNQMNVNYSGISNYKDKFHAHIKINQKMLFLGSYVYEDEALYARWYAEKLLFKEYAFPKVEPIILESRKQEINEYVEQKVQRL